MESLKSKFQRITGKSFFLEPRIEVIEAYLVKQGFLSRDDKIRKVEKPGEGNMNMVLRVIPFQKPPMIMKQARPWVEKYPQVAAPVDRIKVEKAFYELVASHPPLSNYLPGLLGFDAQNNLLLLQDLGESGDYSFVYQKEACFEEHDLQSAVAFLNNLKQVEPPARYPSNLNLRRLNHQHVFYLPFLPDCQFDLDSLQPGLKRASEVCRNDRELRTAINRLGQIYLSPGSTLLHGDFYPGSMLQTGQGLKVIDPEFSFVGPEEWDMAIFTAHLFLASTPTELIRHSVKQFDRSGAFDKMNFSSFAGTEILRRLAGLAQLPLDLTLAQKSRLMDQAIGWIKSGKIPTLSDL